jgi:hypothetical protein
MNQSWKNNPKVVTGANIVLPLHNTSTNAEALP